MSPGAGRRLTPDGLGAVTAFAVSRAAAALAAFELRSAGGRLRRWPGPGRFVAGRLWHRGELLDEIVALGAVREIEWHLHGGRGVAARLEAALAGEGLPLPGPGGDDGAAACAPTTWRAARARLSAERGPLRRLEAALACAGTAGGLDALDGARLQRALAGLRLGERLRRPAVVRIVGRPNAGKSTLFNALLGIERALVSPAAGTTRDPVAAAWSLRGVAVCLEDSAGTEEGGSGADADLLVHLLSDPGETTGPSGGRGGPGRLAVLGQADRRPARCGRPMVSGLTGAGLGELADAIADALGIPAAGPDDLLAPVDAALAQRLARAARRDPEASLGGGHSLES